MSFIPPANFIPRSNGIPLPGLVKQNHIEEKKTSKMEVLLSTIASPFKHAYQSAVKLKRRHSISLACQVIKSHTTSLFSNIANKTSKLKNKIFFHKFTYFEENKLFNTKERIEKTKNAWLLNLALMKDAANSPGVSDTERKQIRFLAANYLYKTAPLPLNIIKKFFKEVTSKHQINGLGRDDDHYHRFSLPKNIDIGRHANRNLAFGNKSPFILTDTIEFEHLLPLKFQVISQNPPEKQNFDTTSLKEHLSGKKVRKALKEQLAIPYLFDLTDSLGGNIQTQGNKDKEKAFQNDFKAYKNSLDQAINEVVNDLIKEKPELAKHKSKLRAFIKNNSTCICRVETETATGIKVLPLYKKVKGEKLMEQHHALADFIISTGIGMGAVNLRKEMLNSFEDEQNVQYCRAGNNETEPAYPERTSILHTALFQRMSHLFDSDQKIEGAFLGVSEGFLQSKMDEVNSKPHIKLFGKATMDMMAGLIHEISDEKWDDINSNAAYRKIMEASLFKIQISLAKAEVNLDNDLIFTQEMELIYAELANLLEITKPYDTHHFEAIYKEAISTSIPQGLMQYTTASLGKTAVNTCAGLNAAVKHNNPDAHCVFSKGFYFEQAGFVGYDKEFDVTINNPDSPKVDLYFGQFNPNIEIASDFTHYERRDVAEDVRRLLDSGKAAEHLTIALDCTIDQYESENVRNLLEDFRTEIEEGRLNFVFFHSGQKFDMLGMDNYFGSPYFMVNNGGSQWDSFNSMPECKVHQTDALSNQWFCLSNQYAQDSLATYRQLIFDNTRHILNNVPMNLKPGITIDPKQRIRVNTAADDMDACFIDIKVSGHNYKMFSAELLGKFYKDLLAKGINVQTKATFGLYDPNILIIEVNEVSGSNSIRIHPGLNPAENAAILEYLKDLSLMI